MDCKGKVFRIIDANINRAKEGSRVCEDLMRLVANDKKSTLQLKRVRHNISKIARDSKIKQSDIIQNRNSYFDVGRKTMIKNSRKTVWDIFQANSQRTKEALRVLEELFRIFDDTASRKFQNLRFRFYTLEKDCYKKVARLNSSK